MGVVAKWASPDAGKIASGTLLWLTRSSRSEAQLEPLLRRPDVEFHCLQKEFRAEDRTWLDQTGLVTTHGAMLRDFADTAALIEAMDMVISIDTAVAHLAGALGIKTYLLLQHCPDWRWGVSGETTGWYPSVTLLRQPQYGDWDSVMAELIKKLQI